MRLICALLVIAALASPAWAQNRNCNRIAGFEEKTACYLEQQVVPIVNDILVILDKGPRYLAKRLPAMQAMGDPGAQMDLVKLGDFSVSVGLISGVYRDFNDIGEDFQKMPKTLPDPVPIPAAMIGVRAAVTPDLEVALRYGFFPEFQAESQGYLIRGTTSIYGARGRFRALRGGGAVPTLVSVADVSYFTGSMDIGRNFTFDLGNTREMLGDENARLLNEAINQELGERVLEGAEPIDVGLFFKGAPIMGWDIYQLSLEQRAVWDVSWWQPYLGLGLDLAGGHVDSGIRGFNADIRAIGPNKILEAAKRHDKRPSLVDIFPDHNVTWESVAPRSVSGRAIAGMEFNMGQAMRLALEAQFDFASYSGIGGFALRYAHR